MNNDALSSYPWQAALELFDDINDTTYFFTKAIMDIALEHIPNREVTVRPSDLGSTKNCSVL